MSLELGPVLNLSTTDPQTSTLLVCWSILCFPIQPSKITLQMNCIMHSAHSPCRARTSALPVSLISLYRNTSFIQHPWNKLMHKTDLHKLILPLPET